MKNSASYKSSNPQMAFIVGMPRSGTTLLTNMFNSHPELVATPENEFVHFAMGKFMHKDFSDPQVVRSFLSIFDHPFNKEMNIWKPGEDVVEDIAKLTVKDFANACKAVYMHYPFARHKQNVKCVIDKNPSYSLYMDKLHKVFPDAKFIVLARDFRDNVLSRIKYGTGKRAVFNLGMTLNFYFERIFKTIDKNNLSHFIVRYEDLVAKPEETLKDLCAYLGVSYSAEMLSFQELSKEMIRHAEKNVPPDTFDKITAMHANLSGEVNKKRVSAYLNELSSTEIAQLDYMCASYAKRFNYPLNGSPIRAIWMVRCAYNWLKVRVFHAGRRLYYALPLNLRLSWLKKK